MAELDIMDEWDLNLKSTGISLGMRPANERCHYNVTTSLIG